MRIPGITAATKIGPDAPTLVSVTNIGTNREFDNGAVDVVFTAATTTPSNPAVSYKVEVSTGVIVTGATSPIRIQGLASNSNLTFFVRGVNVLGIEGAASATSASTLITTVPDKPDIGIAGSGNASAVVPFSLSNTGGRDIVEYIIAGSPSGSAIGASSPITVSSLSNGTDYTFTVVARNANGNSLPSNPTNVVRPSAPVSSGGGGGGGGIVTTTYYCYKSVCTSVFGSSQYDTAPTLDSISTSNNDSTNSVFSGYDVFVTTVINCDPNQTTALNGSKQQACEGAIQEDLPLFEGCTDPDTVVFGPCPADDSFLWVTTTTFDECNGTFFTEIASQAAWQTFTLYNCSGDVVSSSAGPTCSRNKVLSSTQINGQCGYTTPPRTTATTGNNPSTGGVGSGTPFGQAGGNTGPVTSNPPAETSTVITTTDTEFMFILLDTFPDADIGYIGATDTWVVTVPNSNFDFGGGCFAVGTKITMADGSLKNIEDLQLGDEIRTFDIPGAPDSDKYEDWLADDIWSTDSTDDFTITTSKVTHLKVGPYPIHYKINNKYRVTHEHLILVNREGAYSFKEVKKLKVGDKFITETREEIDIFDIQLVKEKITTVELDVEDNDFYFADGILAHNIIAPVSSFK
jgi:hypothetical protein